MIFRSLGALAALVALQSAALADPVAPFPAVAHTHHRHVIHHASLPVAPIAPLSAPTPIASDTQAPVPNEWVTAPIAPALTETEVAPAVLQIHYPPQGDGFPLGSSPQAMDDREAGNVTGVEMKMPIGQ